MAAGIALAGATLVGSNALAAASPRVARPALARTFSGRLYGVTATSATNAWAVGLHPNSSLIVHWNGHSWSQALAGDGFFESVAATSATNAWAVGGTGWFTTEPMVYHWNGQSWTQATVPDPRLGGHFTSVTAISADDVWAVGLTGGGPGDGIGKNNVTLIEHWNGQAWSLVRSPAPSPESGLDGVSGISATDAWAVGWTGTAANNGTYRTLILGWNGHAWRRVPSPSGVPGVRTGLNAVLTLSAQDAWAVGGSHQNRNQLVFIVHWNGRAWTKVHSPTPGLGAQLLGIGGSSPSSIWAVGQTTIYGGCSPANCAGGIVHWNGHRWSVVHAPNPPSGYLNSLFAVAVTSAGNAWAVGTTDYQNTLIARWNGHRWS
jgi:hypothetical protein